MNKETPEAIAFILRICELNKDRSMFKMNAQTIAGHAYAYAERNQN